MFIAQELARHALSLNEDSLSTQVLSQAKINYIDGLSCMFLGTGSASVKAAIPYVIEHCAKQDCIFPGPEPLRVDVAHCAMLGAIAAHSNDFDDMSPSLNGHPSALLVPITFALGQKLHSSGMELLCAYISGVEVDAILGRAMLLSGYHKGWNATNFLGIFGAVTVAARLFRLDENALARALCIAVNEASGLKANFGTKAKDLAIGMTALKAIAIAENAVYFDASLDAFEGEFGFFNSMQGHCDTDKIHQLINQHVSEFMEPGMIIKPYPSCRGNHTGIDCIRTLVQTYHFSVEEVDSILCQVDANAYDTDRYEYPENPGQAKFSLAFCIAKIISEGEISVEDFIGEAFKDKHCLELISKIKIVKSPELFYNSRYGTQVTVMLKNGTVLTEKADYAKGDPRCPLTNEELSLKLISCLKSCVSDDKAREIASELNNFAALSDLCTILDQF